MPENKHNFGDGNGAVPAHRHPNGGGWVADTASVSKMVYVHKTGMVYDYATVGGQATIGSRGRVYGDAVIGGQVKVLNGSVGGICVLGADEFLDHGEKYDEYHPTHEYEGHRVWTSVQELAKATEDES